MLNKTTSFLGKIIFECLGEVHPIAAAKALVDKTYLFPVAIETAGQKFMINASQFGNLSRFVNHRCSPNSRIFRTASSEDLMKNKLVMFAHRDIAAGEEITINYTLDCALLKYGVDCLCDSGRCLDKF